MAGYPSLMSDIPPSSRGETGGGWVGYITDRELGPSPLTADAMDERVWGSLYALVAAWLVDASIDFRFPDQCPDGSWI